MLLRIYARPENCYTKSISVSLPKAIFLGDSNMLGTVGHDFVNDFNSTQKTWYALNAGINSETSENILRRIDDVTRINPDALVIMIGTNDILASLSFTDFLYFKCTKNIRRRPTPHTYQQNIERIIQSLSQEIKSRTHFISIPYFDATKDSAANLMVDIYNKRLMEVCNDNEINFIDLQKSGFYPESFFQIKRDLTSKLGWSFPIYRAAFMKFYRNYKTDRISDRYGYTFTVDGIHLNTQSANNLNSILITKILHTGRMA